MPASQTVFVTGAAGHLGQLVIAALLETMPAGAVVAGVRDPAGDGATALARRGIQIRQADYAQPETLARAFDGVDRLLLISSSENGQRRAQHRNVIDAARAAGVSLLAYTSILHADASPLFLAEEHRDTEAALAESGVPYVLLRNGWYNEVYTWRLPLALRNGELMGAAGNGRISSAAREDYARAAAAVLTEDGHAGKTYELAGDASFTLSDLAAIVAGALGRPMPYLDITPDAFQAALLAAGLPDFVARVMSDTDAGVADGALFDDGHTLSRLTGRPTVPIESTITQFIKAEQETQ